MAHSNKPCHDSFLCVLATCIHGHNAFHSLQMGKHDISPLYECAYVTVNWSPKKMPGRRHHNNSLGLGKNLLFNCTGSLYGILHNCMWQYTIPPLTCPEFIPTEPFILIKAPATPQMLKPPSNGCPRLSNKTGFKSKDLGFGSDFTVEVDTCDRRFQEWSIGLSTYNLAAAL